MLKILEILTLSKKTASSIVKGEKPIDLEKSEIFNEKDKKYIIDTIRNEAGNTDRLDFIENIDAHNDFRLIKSEVQFSKRKYYFFWYAAAALAVILLTVSIVIFRNNKPANEINKVVEIAKATIKQKPLYKNDVKPGGNKAILTLADGTKIVLDDASKGALTSQGNTTIIKLDDGRLTYNSQEVSKIPPKALIYNTLSTPRGGQYCVTLPDGTIVWLNASTSLKFPVAFIGNERRVEVKGEAYFEVAKNAAMPFFVRAGNQEIKVLGTHFNVTAYADDKVIKTTLLEGSVEVSIPALANTESGIITLQPGQQAQLDKEDALKVVEANPKEAIAWKNGFFMFKNENIESIMLKISRWYDVEIKYETNTELKEFTGTIARTNNVSDVLAMLELTQIIHFKIEGKTITVLP